MGGVRLSKRATPFLTSAIRIWGHLEGWSFPQHRQHPGATAPENCCNTDHPRAAGRSAATGPLPGIPLRRAAQAPRNSTLRTAQSRTAGAGPASPGLRAGLCTAAPSAGRRRIHSPAGPLVRPARGPPPSYRRARQGPRWRHGPDRTGCPAPGSRPNGAGRWMQRTR